MFKVTNNEITRYKLPDGNIYEYDFDYFAKFVIGRIYSKDGRLLAKAKQALWPWTKALSPEEMYNRVKEIMI